MSNPYIPNSGSSGSSTPGMSGDQFRQFATQRGWVNQDGSLNNSQQANDSRLYVNARNLGLSADDLDSAFGWGGGTAQGWVTQRGLPGLAGQSQPQSQPGQMGPAQQYAGPEQYSGQLSGAPAPAGYAAPRQSLAVGLPGGMNGTPGVMGPEQYPGTTPTPRAPLAGAGTAPPAAASSVRGLQTGAAAQAGSGNGINIVDMIHNSGASGGVLSQGGISNPHMNAQADSIMRRATDNLQRNILPGIRSGSIQAGGLGGSRQGIAEGNAITGTQQSITDSLAGLYANLYGQDQNTETARRGQDQSFYSTQRGQDLQGTELGARLFGQGQSGLAAQGQGVYQAGQNQTAAEQQPLMNYANILSLFSGLGGGQVNSQSNNNVLGQILGTALAGAQFGNNLFGTKP